MHQVPKHLRHVVDGIRAAGYDPAAAFSALSVALAHPALKKPVADAAEDSGITCEVCRDDAWWQANFGAGWELVQWWYCGPFGLECPPRES